MNFKWVYAVIITLIALAMVPFGMNAFGARNPVPIDPSVSRLFLATSVIAWMTLVLFAVYLTFARHELANFAWITILGVFGSYFLINFILWGIR